MAEEQRLSATALAEAFKERSGIAWLILLTITHQGLAPELRRWVNAREDVVSNGETYKACEFDVILPEQDGEHLGRARLRISNIDRDIQDAILYADPPPKVQFQIVLSSDPDEVEQSTGELRLERVTADVNWIEGELGPPDTAVEPYPGDSFTPANFPGLF